MDRQSVYSAHVYDFNNETGEETRVKTRKDLEEFILKFRFDNNFVYRYVVDKAACG